MECPTCKAENSDGARQCSFCGQPLNPSLPAVRISHMAVISMTLGVIVPPVFLLLLSGFQALAAIGLLVAPLLAVLLGFISLIRIFCSRGTLSGEGYAYIGMLVPLSAFIFLILNPWPHKLDFRLTCGTNLSGIGKAMLIYANDYDDKLPKAGSRVNDWGDSLANGNGWDAGNHYTAYGYTSASQTGTVTPSSSLYLLVKYVEVTPKQFVCKGDTDTTEFKLSQVKQKLPPDFQLTDAWDFGPTPDKHCSYAYHWPFDEYALTTSADPSMAIAADRNPWLTNTESEKNTWDSFTPDIAPWKGSKKGARKGNSRSHRLDGQNVLFLDSHVKFTRRSFCGIDKDNIYTPAETSDPNSTSIKGLRPIRYDTSPKNRPKSKLDSYLVQ